MGVVVAETPRTPGHEPPSQTAHPHGWIPAAWTRQSKRWRASLNDVPTPRWPSEPRTTLPTMALPIGVLIPATPCTPACTCTCTRACTSERPPRSFPVIVRPLVPIRPSPPASPELADSAGFVNEKPPVSSCDIGGRQSGRGGSNSRHSAWEADVLPLNYAREPRCFGAGRAGNRTAPTADDSIHLPTRTGDLARGLLNRPPGLPRNKGQIGN